MKPKLSALILPLDEAAELLLSLIFTGLPVVDKHNRPVGLLTQGDLIRKGGLPLRLGLLAESGHNRRKTLLKQTSSRRAVEVMSSPVVLIDKGLKRLLVIDTQGRFQGMISRDSLLQMVFTGSDKIETKFQGDETQDKVTGAQTGFGSSDNR